MTKSQFIFVVQFQPMTLIKFSIIYYYLWIGSDRILISSNAAFFDCFPLIVKKKGLGLRTCHDVFQLKSFRLHRFANVVAKQNY